MEGGGRKEREGVGKYLCLGSLFIVVVPLIFVYSYCYCITSTTINLLIIYEDLWY